MFLARSDCEVNKTGNEHILTLTDVSMHLITRIFGHISKEFFSRDVTAAMLVTLNKGTATMLLSPANHLGIELCSNANVFFCFG